MMEVSTISGEAKCLAFPMCKCIDGSRYRIDKLHNWVTLPISDDRYLGFGGNEHHYTTTYHRKFVLPELEKLLNFGYNPSDFVIKENQIQHKGKFFDMSYLVPLKNKHFTVTSLSFNIQYDCDFSGLLKNEHTAKLTWFSPYHDLFCLPHSCATILNKDISNGKNLLILGDSQLIPSLPVLCYYYTTVTYIDNRDKKDVLTKLKDSYDDILIEIFAQKIDYYLNYLRGK